MIPLKDLNPTTRTAFVTVVLLLANVGVYFLVQEGRSAQDELEFTYEWAAVPCEIVQREPLTFDEINDTLRGIDDACRSGSSASTEPSGSTPAFPDKLEWVAVLVSMFLHGGLLHLGGTMLYLWSFGNHGEDRLGHVAFTAFYLAGGVVATIAHVAVNADSTVPLVGASGAIAAVMGAYLVWYPDARIRTLLLFFFVFFTEIRAKWLLGFWVVSQFFINENSGVAWVAHVGGFAFGVVFGLLLGPGRTRPRPLRYVS